jgi:hypothetical protein
MCSKAPPTLTRSISKKEMKGKTKNVISLEENPHPVLTY